MATADGPARRRESWSLKTIVEDIAGRPIHELQDPNRPTHPYLRVKAGASDEGGTSVPTGHSVARASADDEAGEIDPVERFFPPLSRSVGRDLHGPERVHHADTLQTAASPLEPLQPGQRRHAPGPSQRPERIYLHYLLLHMDRLSDPAIRYLKHAVDDEVRHREASSPPDATPAPTS
jgi:hypothetical protein